MHFAFPMRHQNRTAMDQLRLVSILSSEAPRIDVSPKRGLTLHEGLETCTPGPYTWDRPSGLIMAEICGFMGVPLKSSSGTIFFFQSTPYGIAKMAEDCHYER